MARGQGRGTGPSSCTQAVSPVTTLVSRKRRDAPPRGSWSHTLTSRATRGGLSPCLPPPPHCKGDSRVSPGGKTTPMGNHCLEEPPAGGCLMSFTVRRCRRRPHPAPESARQQVQWPSGQLRGTWHRPDGRRCWRPLLQSPGADRRHKLYSVPDPGRGPESPARLAGRCGGGAAPAGPGAHHRPCSAGRAGAGRPQLRRRCQSPRLPVPQGGGGWECQPQGSRAGPCPGDKHCRSTAGLHGYGDRRG